MNPIDAVLSDSFGQALGLALLHFVWQGALVALLLAVALYLLRRRSAQVRYAASCVAMLLVLTLPAVTFGLLLQAPADASATLSVAPPEATVTTEANTTPALAPLPETPPSWQQETTAMMHTALPWLVLLWMAGVLGLSMRYLAGWTYTLRLRRRGTREVGQRWHDQLTDLKQRMGIRRTVRLASSLLVRVPTVTGWLRPIILMPVSVFTGLSPRQIEMVLAHELAHIRRHDYLINLLQAACETVLFYHPAVWWVSKRIRIEREHCCDDVVVSVCGDAYTYVAALAKMEEVRQRTPQLALAATGGSLLDRVRRLLEGPDTDTPRSARWFAGLIVLSVFALSLFLSSVLGTIWSNVQHGTPAATDQEEARAYFSFEDAEERGQRFQALMQSGDYEQTAQKLEAFIFEDRSTRTQLEALDELRALPRRASVPALATIAERHPRQRVRLEAIQWVGRMGDAYVVAMLERMAFDDQSRAVQMEALDALRNLPDKIGLPSLIKFAQTHPRDAMRSEAVQWLGRLGDEAARVTLAKILYADAAPYVQEETFDALKSLPRGLDPMVLREIAFEHPNEAVREKALEELKRVLLPQRVQEKFQRERALRMQANRSENPYADTAQRLETLIFDSDDQAVQLEALDALANLSARISLPSLERIADTHPDTQVQSQATRLVDIVTERLKNEEQHTITWSQALKDLDHEDKAQRIQAVKALEASASRRATGVLTKVAFNDPSTEVQAEALDALRDRDGLEALAAIARIARQHPNAAIRTEALHSMGTMALHDKLDVLEEVIFNDESPSVQSAALVLLKDLPKELSMPLLGTIARRHPNATIRDEAQRYLNRFLEEREDDTGETYSWQQALVDLDATAASRRLIALRKVKEKEGIDFIPILADMAYEDPSLEVQLEILDIFRDRGDWDGTSWVVHIVRNHPDAEMRQEAVQSLEGLNPDEYTALLEEVIFRDQSLAVQLEALDLVDDLPVDKREPLLRKISQRQRLPDELRMEATEMLEDDG